MTRLGSVADMSITCTQLHDHVTKMAAYREEGSSRQIGIINPAYGCCIYTRDHWHHFRLLYRRLWHYLRYFDANLSGSATMMMILRNHEHKFYNK